MLPDGAFYFFGKEPGAGGMPSGSGGRVACLLSGGIDSPVAAYRLMRRGCSVLLIHFHSYPILSRASQEKVREIAALLTQHQLRSRLMLVPFGELQQQVVLAVPPEMRVVIYRRLMLRIAERLARKGHARALVTGEVIGQVASQTLENMTAIARGDLARDPAAAGRDGQGRDHRRGDADRDVSDLDHPGSGLLHAVHAAASGDARRGWPRWSDAEQALPIDEMVGGRAGGGGRGGLPIPGARITGCARKREGEPVMTFQIM